jgi:hypothetical protein
MKVFLHLVKLAIEGIEIYEAKGCHRNLLCWASRSGSIWKKNGSSKINKSLPHCIDCCYKNIYV